MDSAEKMNAGLADVGGGASDESRRIAATHAAAKFDPAYDVAIGVEWFRIDGRLLLELCEEGEISPFCQDFLDELGQLLLYTLGWLGWGRANEASDEAKLLVEGVEEILDRARGPAALNPEQLVEIGMCCHDLADALEAYAMRADLDCLRGVVMAPAPVR